MMAAFLAGVENLPRVTSTARSAPAAAASRWNRATTSRPSGDDSNGSYRFACTATLEDKTSEMGASPIPSIPSSPDPPTRVSSSP
jgi:hypothetical protein